MLKISVLQIVTNKIQSNESRKYIESQKIDAEIQLIQIENYNNKFPSAAVAFNSNVDGANGDILVFMHQDVYLWDENALKKLVQGISTDKEAIVGVAGVSTFDGKIYSDIYETRDKIMRSNSCIDRQIEAITLDECLFVMTRDKYNSIKFDEQTTDNWHFYAADICYENYLKGNKNYIIPLQICHESLGNVRSYSFEKSLRKMIKKYYKKISRLETTCIQIECSWYGYIKYIIKMRIWGLLHKIRCILNGKQNEK